MAFAGLTIVGLGFPPDMDFLPGRFDILVTHMPPGGCNDSILADHLGDEALRDAILERKPALALSGHVHESRGICTLGGTVCVNPGPAMEGYGAVIDISETLAARLVETTAKL